MKKLTTLVLVLMTAALMAEAQEENPLWMRYGAISPDGSTIAFSYKGDIWTVPSAGGAARQITSASSFESNPIWSPDGTKIAFVSDRYGSKDVFVVSARGGVSKRLTTNSGNETPIVWRDDDTILFGAYVMPSAESMQFPDATFSQVYSVRSDGGRPVMFSTLPLQNICFSPDGNSFLYTDIKGYEDPWRKHHTSPIARDIWKCTLKAAKGTPQEVKDATFEKLTGFEGEDRNAVFSPDGRSIFWLSEQDGTFNVWKAPVMVPKKDVGNINASAVQITRFKGNPVRFLSIASDGTLCFGYDGELYTMKEGGEPQKVKVEIVADIFEKEVVRRDISGGAGDYAVSKDGKQVAFIYHGDVYVTSSEYSTTKQITDTPEQERDIDFAPDGRSIVYSSERNGLWQVYMTSIVNGEEKFFPYATELKEENLTNSSKVSFQPLFSPNGKEVAFLENRTEIRVVNLASRQVRTVMDGKLQYSYSDGDQHYRWSPDSRWILTNCIFTGGWNNQDVALVDASGNGVIHNLTKSGYNDTSAEWVLDGKAMIWESDRAGYRSHGSWGAESDIYIMFFDLKAYEEFNMDKEELALKEEADKEKKEKEDKAKESEKEKKDKSKKKGAKDDSEKEEEVEPLEFDLENAEYRIKRLTVNSSFLGTAALSKKGDKLFYLTSFEGDMDLWVHDLKEGDTKIFVKGVGGRGMMISDDGETLYVASRGALKKISTGDGKTETVDFKSTFNFRPSGERQYILDHTSRQVAEKFYDPTLRGLDWEGYHKSYGRFLPHINNGYDYSEMLSEMLGELNGSHTGCRFYPAGASQQTAYLGVFYDETYTGDGLKIKEIVKRSPFALKDCGVAAGCIIEKVDGEPIAAGADYYPLFEGKAGKKVRLTINDPAAGKRFEVVVEPISLGEQTDLLYSRWVERNRVMVEKMTGGKIGYVHIEGMDSKSYRELYKELLGRLRDCDAVVVDTRHNGGGWLHDDVATLLSGREYVRFTPRGQYIGSEPYSKWNKPSCMLICEDNYSDAHGTPTAYRALGIGKLVGAPMAGTMTAVWWERQISGDLVFGIPMVGALDSNGNYLENQQLDPDVVIYNTQVEVMNGIDRQLEGAVKVLE